PGRPAAGRTRADRERRLPARGRPRPLRRRVQAADLPRDLGVLAEQAGEPHGDLGAPAPPGGLRRGRQRDAPRRRQHAALPQGRRAGRPGRRGLRAAHGEVARGRGGHRRLAGLVPGGRGDERTVLGGPPGGALPVPRLRGRGGPVAAVRDHDRGPRDGMTGKLWGGNYTADPDQAFWAFNRSLPFDRRLLREEIAASRGYVAALGRCGALPAADAAALEAGLAAVLAEAGDPAEVQGEDEDVHSLVESRLAAKVGALAGQAHLGRS